MELNEIRNKLAILEPMIITSLVARAQFGRNLEAYVSENGELSLLEKLHGNDEVSKKKAGKFRVPEERPFYVLDNLENLELRGIDSALCGKIRMNDEIKLEYLSFLNDLCPEGSDGDFGSASEKDILCLTELAKRIHFGTYYVSESKFSSDPEIYTELARNNDREGIMEELTNVNVENVIYQRVLMAADATQVTQRTTGSGNYVEPSLIADFFRDVVIPITKKGEVEYLYFRGING